MDKFNEACDHLSDLIWDNLEELLQVVFDFDYHSAVDFLRDYLYPYISEAQKELEKFKDDSEKLNDPKILCDLMRKYSDKFLEDYDDEIHEKQRIFLGLNY